MKFPGKRKSKHYFPVSERGRTSFDTEAINQSTAYVVGIDQLLVDIEASVNEQFLQLYGLKKGESCVLCEDVMEEIYQVLKKSDKIVGEYAGGAIGNTLHNYSVLADDVSVALGAICENIPVGSYAFKYICSTSSRVDLTHLQPFPGNMGRALCLVTQDNERTFGIGKGIMDQLSAEGVPAKVIQNSAALVVSSFLLRDESAPMYLATMRAVQLAKESNVPVVMAMGTSSLVEEKREFILDFLEKYVTVAAMNIKEAEALVGEGDPLLAAEKVLDLVDLTLVTVGHDGLYLAGHVDESLTRRTADQIHSKAISEYNKFEYSRAQRREDCDNPVKIYTHINPFMGGPLTIKNTNGAGDAALAAVLHDISANFHHRVKVPSSPKQRWEFLTYSSLHQVSKYANRVSYEVLRQNSPRLYKGLPEKEDCLEEGYWSQ